MRRMVLGMAGLGVALVLATMPARGEIILTAVQNASGVVISGGGTADTSDLTFVENSTSPSGVEPDIASLLTGPVGAALDVGAYIGLTSGPPNLGGGGATAATSGEGDAFGATFLEGFIVLVLPKDYKSLAPLQGSATFAGATFASLGLTPGTYTWTWASGGEIEEEGSADDSMVLTVVPEPSSLTLAAIAAGLTVGVVRRRRSRPV